VDRRILTALRLMAALGAIAAPALVALAVMTQSAEAQTASDLPRAPYASSSAPATYGGAQSYDRYGGGGAHPVVRPATQAPAYAGPRLSWSGKTDIALPAPRTPAYAAARYVAPPPAPISAPIPASSAAEAPAPNGWRYMPPIGPTAAGPTPVATAQPATIYDPAPPQAPAAAQIPVDGGVAGSTARRYSLHREYGLTPDPIPLPPQFFGATADLTQSESPEPQRRTTGADGKSRNALQPTDGQ